MYVCIYVQYINSFNWVIATAAAVIITNSANPNEKINQI